METTGAPHSSDAATHCSTVIISLIVDLYSRIRPQPVHVKLQACKGSSIMTSGNFSAPRMRLPAMYFDMLAVRLNGNLTSSSDSERARTTESKVDTSGTSGKTLSENLFR